GLNGIAIVAGFVHHDELRIIHDDRGVGRLDHRPARGLGGRWNAPTHRTWLRIGLGEAERERAAAARRTCETDLAAQESCDLTADREAKARASILAARAAIGLLERLEDDLLFVRGDA